MARFDLEQAQKQLVQRERLSAVGAMASGIAHDLNNSLSPVIVYGEMLQKKSMPIDECESAIDAIMLGARQAAGVVNQLQALSPSSIDGSATSTETIDLSRVVRKVITLTRPRWHDEQIQHGTQIRIHRDLSENALIQGNSVEMTQVLTNLVFNAVDAMSDGGNIYIKTTKVDENGRA